MADFEKEKEEQIELSVEVVSDTSSEPDVELVKISDEDAPLGEVEELSVQTIGGYCPHCGLGISIDVSSIPKDE